MSAVVEMLGDKDIKHVPIVLRNSEQNGLAERFNGTIMNSVGAAIATSVMLWEYWTWALADEADK